MPVQVPVREPPDRGEVGEVENETFSAIELTVTFPGVGTHPGYAKGKLVNPIKLAAAFIEKLPRDALSPETTEGREGYVHPHRIDGGAETCTVTFLLRDHAVPELLQHHATPQAIAAAAFRWLDDPAAVRSLQQRFAALHRELRRDTGALATAAIEAVLQR